MRSAPLQGAKVGGFMRPAARLILVTAVSISYLFVGVPVVHADECNPSDPGEAVFVPLPPDCDDDGMPFGPANYLWADPVAPEDGPEDTAQCTLTPHFALKTNTTAGTDIFASGEFTCNGATVTKVEVRSRVQKKVSGTWENRGTIGYASCDVPAGCTASNDVTGFGRFECSSTTWSKYRAKAWGTVTFVGGATDERGPRRTNAWAGRCRKP